MKLLAFENRVTCHDFVHATSTNVTLSGKTRLNEISVEPFLHLNAFSNVENALEIIFNAF